MCCGAGAGNVSVLWGWQGWHQSARQTALPHPSRNNSPSLGPSCKYSRPAAKGPCSHWEPETAAGRLRPVPLHATYSPVAPLSPLPASKRPLEPACATCSPRDLGVWTVTWESRASHISLDQGPPRCLQLPPLVTLLGLDPLMSRAPSRNTASSSARLSAPGPSQAAARIPPVPPTELGSHQAQDQHKQSPG